LRLFMGPFLSRSIGDRSAKAICFAGEMIFDV
jgi:hypothetical protein